MSSAMVTRSRSRRVVGHVKANVVASQQASAGRSLGNSRDARRARQRRRTALFNKAGAAIGARSVFQRLLKKFRDEMRSNGERFEETSLGKRVLNKVYDGTTQFGNGTGISNKSLLAIFLGLYSYDSPEFRIDIPSSWETA